MAYNIHELLRVPQETPVELEVGSWFHQLMERKLKGVVANDAGPELPGVSEAAGGAHPVEHAQWSKHRLWIPAEAYEMDPAWEVLGVEHVLSATVGKVQLQGRLDALVRYNGKYWSLQWKTFSGDLVYLIDKVRLSWHEVAYQLLARLNGYEPWGGTILGACEKLPGYRIVAGGRRDVTDEERINAFTTHYVCRGHEVQARMEHDLTVLLERMDSSLSTQTRNYDACFQGRRRCPYFGVCHHGDSIEGPEFRTASPRYIEV